MARFGRRYPIAVLTGLALVLAVHAGRAENPFERAPYPDEKAAVERLFKDRTPGARHVLAWIRHDHAVELIAAYHRNGKPADLETGIKYARSATELAPDVVTFWRLLAMAALSYPQGDVTPLLAESALLRVLELAPDDRESRRLLTDLYVGTGQDAEAVPHYLHLLETLPEGQPDFDSAKMAYACLEGAETGRCTLALEKATEARLQAVRDRRLKGHESPAELLVALAILYRAQHRETEARERLDAILLFGAASEAPLKAAVALRKLWDETGPLADAPDEEDWP